MSISRWKRNRFASRVLIFGIIVVASCQPDAPAAQRSERSAVDVILTVRNQSRRAVQVSLKSDLAGQMLGKVASGASQPFSVSSALVGSPTMLRLEAIGDGGVAVRSEGFGLRRGQKVVWTFTDTGRGTVEKR